MFELPDNLPPPVAADSALVARCVNLASSHFDIHPLVIHLILDVEGGSVGTMSRNSNGTYDMGLMQINTVNLPKIQAQYPDLTWYDIAYKPCVNIAVGSWILKKRLSETPDFWTGVGNYHSKTPRFRKIYLERIRNAYARRIQRQANNAVSAQ